VVEKLPLLEVQAVDVREIFGISDVMMRADGEKVARLGQKRANGAQFDFICFLRRSKRIETDDNQGIDPLDHVVIEQSLAAVGLDAFQFKDRLAALGTRLLREGDKVLLHDVIQEAGNALVEAVRIGELLKAWIKHPATFEERRKSIFDDGKGCADFAGTAPCVIKERSYERPYYPPCIAR
jgi:hypothetical protein